MNYTSFEIPTMISDTIIDEMTTLVTALNEELQRRNWSMRELARRADISHSWISQVVNGNVTASPEFVMLIADAFAQPRDKWLRFAEMLPPLPPALEDEQAIVYALRQLAPEERNVIKRAITGLVSGDRMPLSRASPEREERMNTPVLGNAVCHLGHPIRLIYETLFEILPPDQFKEMVIRLHESRIHSNHDGVNSPGTGHDERTDAREATLLPGGITSSKGVDI
jgi:transcriptional regulator with XRE-family HTH domain